MIITHDTDVWLKGSHSASVASSEVESHHIQVTKSDFHLKRVEMSMTFSHTRDTREMRSLDFLFCSHESQDDNAVDDGDDEHV